MSRLILFVSILFFIVACGGGGSSSSGQEHQEHLGLQDLQGLEELHKAIKYKKKFKQ